MGNFININDTLTIKKDSIISAQMINLTFPCYLPVNQEAERGKALLQGIEKKKDKLEALHKKLEKNMQKRSIFSKEKENLKIELEIENIKKEISSETELAQRLMEAPDPSCEYVPDLGQKGVLGYVPPRMTRNFVYSTYPLLLIEYNGNQECKTIFISNVQDVIQHIDNAELAYNSFYGRYQNYYTTNFGEWDKSSYEEAAIKFYLNMPQGTYLYSEQLIQDILLQISES